LLVASGLCVWLMLGRILAFHREHPRKNFAFQRVESREFSFAGRPVTLADDLQAGSVPELVVSYGDVNKRIAMTVPPPPDSPRWKLPDLLPHEDWLRVLRMVETGPIPPREALAKLDRGEIPDRLILVVRVPPPGVDPNTWGNVWRKQWSFDFYELDPAGTIVRHDRLRYPAKSGFRQPREGDLRENTWQYQAALQTMPPESKIGPSRNFFGNALAAAGWTLPASAFAALGATLLLVFAAAPARRVNNAR
jgi:hypothetical protein